MIQEKAGNEDNAFPSLASNISTVVESQLFKIVISHLAIYLHVLILPMDSGWIVEPPKAAMEVTLMSLVPPDCRMPSQSQPSQSDQVYATSDQNAWLSGTGVRLLHIHAPNAIGTADVAEQIGHQFILRRQAAGSYWARPFAFDFAMVQPTRRPIQDMMIAAILHFFAFACNLETSPRNDLCAMLQDQFGLYNAWLEDDARNMFELFTYQFSDDYLFLLHGLEHCPQESRAILWSLLSDLAERSEECFRFVVTSGDAHLLSSEICNSGVHYDECRLDDLYAGPEPLDHEANMKSMVLRLSPGGQGRVEIRQLLSKAQHMQHSVLENYISFVQRRTCWPKTASESNLSQFCSLLEALNTNKIPGLILSKLLEAYEDQEQTELALAWVFYGYRPLSPLELVEIVLHTGRSQNPRQTDYSSEKTPRQILQHFRSTLGSFVDFSSCQVRMHADVAELLGEEEDCIWGRVTAAAPQLTLDFLLNYLKSSDTQERLRVLYRQYEAKVKVAGENITPPMEKTGEDALLYAVQALPHHLSMAEVHLDTQSLLKDPQGPYSAWARLYWAMSNPFSRPRGGPCLSAWATWRMVSSSSANMICIRDTLNDHDGKREGEETSDRDSAEISIMVELQNAVRANNKDMAVNLARQLVEKHESASPNRLQDIQWPPSILWRATWLNMVELVDLLLNNGVQPDDISSAHVPSPLFLAAILGLGRLVEILLGYGADVTVKKKPGMKSLVASAAACGHARVVEALVRDTPRLIEEASPATPLYRACYWGSFKVVEALLKMKADVDQPGSTLESAIAMDNPNQSNPPLVAACERGHVNIVRLLLAHGAMVNAPARLDTAISWAAIDARSLDCVRLLLQYGADPNHELLSPPLLTQIMQTSMTDDEKVAMFEVLVNNIPPVLVDKPDVDAYGGKTPLMEAALQGELIAVRWLLEHGADTGTVDNGNRHALYYAVQSKNRAVVEEILKHQALENRNIVASDGCTVLEASIDDLPLFKLLLEANLDPEVENGKGQTALNVAAVEEKVEAVSLLLQRNVDVHHRDKVGWSPILDATGFQPNPEIARLLLERGADPQDSTRDKSTTLHHAALESRPDVLRVLLEFREYLDLDARNDDDKTALSLAYESTTTEEEKECIKLLIRAGADVNYARGEDGRTLLMLAAQAVPSDPNLDDCLLTAPKINENAISRRFGTALTVACRNANFHLASKLLDRGADVNFYAPILGSTPLIAACLPWWSLSQRGVDLDDYFSRSEQLIRELISRGADVNLERGSVVHNALSAAALMGSINAINYLLDKGASVGKRDPLGRQAIHFSAASGLRNFEGLCLAAGDDIRTPDNFGKNVLHWAAQFGHVKTVQSIMRRLSFLSARDRRDFINSKDIDGWTPLAWASRPVIADQWLDCGWSFSEEQNYAATIQFLIEEGADPTMEFQVHPERSDEMITAWKMAKRCQLELPEEIFCLLKSKADVANTTDSTDNDQGNAERSEESLKYVRRSVDCDICLSVSQICPPELQPKY